MAYMDMKKWLFTLICFLLSLTAFAQWNNPYIESKPQNTLYSAFSSQPKTLDPAKAYSSNEIELIMQIYEPPLEYDYLARPFKLIPLTLTKMPNVTYLDKNQKALPNNTSPSKIAFTVYDLTIKPGIYYQPHPAFKQKRELTANDYVYQIKRLADPRINSPIFGILSQYIVGFHNFSKTLQQAYQKNKKVNLRQYTLPGATVINKYEYQIMIHGIYPQFLYWLAMPFFSPMPYEADLFYAAAENQVKNLTLNWFPIGTGPYMLTENNPNSRMVLTKNPNFRNETHPITKEKIPAVDKLVLSLDKESIPRWNKFLQGYYDRSGISADSFDQAIQLDKNGQAILTPNMKQKGIRLETSISPSIAYIGFNMLDDVVGGPSIKHKKLRQAIAIAIDYEEYIRIFMNGRGIPAQGPIPPGIFGYQKNDINKTVYFWEGKKILRKSITTAKKLMTEAGYPNGIDPKTGKPLILNYDVSATANPDDKAQLNWMRKQFAKLGIELNIRATDYNRFQDKVRNGNAQIFSWGWMADYPDPENFLFLLDSHNGKVKYHGENASNYSNLQFDKLFDEIKNMPNNAARLKKIHQALTIIRDDTPWIFGLYPINFTLTQQWVEPNIPHPIANNTLKYQKINPHLRAKLQKNWNNPVLWPFFALLFSLILIFIPLFITYWKRENKPNVKRD